MARLLREVREENEPPSLLLAPEGIEPVPSEVERVLEEHLNGDQRKLVVGSDLTLEGAYGRAWLVATPHRLLTINRHPDRRYEVHELPLEDIERLEKQEFIGNGALLAHTPQGTRELIRYSLTLADKFDEAKDVLERLIREAKGQEEGEEALELPRSARREKRLRQKGRCPSCGRALPSGRDVCPACLKKSQLILRLLQYVKPFWPQSVLSLVLMVAITWLDILPTVLQKTLIDRAIPKGDLKLLLWIVLAILGIRILLAILSGYRGYLVAWLGQRIVMELRKQLYAHLHTLSLSFYDRKQTGSLMYRITSDTGRLQDFLATGLQDILRDVVTAILIAVILFRYDLQLALLTLTPIPLIVFGSKSFSRRIHRVYHRVWRQWSRMSAMMADALPGVRVVKAFNQERREVRRFVETNHSIFRTGMHAAKMSNIFYPTMGFLTVLGTLTVWGYGGYRVIVEHDLTLGTLIVFIGLIWRFYGPVHNLSHMSDRIQQVATSAERVFELLDTQPEIQSAPNALRLKDVEGHIRFEHVTFRYEGNHEALKDITFEIRPGEMIGVVGPTGSGKTTLINLICRFYDPQEGAIYLDGVDLRQIEIGSLRSFIGVVLQEPYLFHGTIAENIAYGKPDATLEEIIQAAKVANAHDFILRLPDGYDTMVGERGLRLSGGEKQRISIARAVLKNPKILILDEATSSVDTETEAQIQEAIERLISNRTTIAIAHRLSTLKRADRIIVLDKGRLVEMGTHEELLAKEDGVFARLCRIQQELAKSRAV